MTGLLAAALTAPAAAASGLELSLHDGRVTIRAQEVQITDILAEWGRVGNTAIIDADKLAGKTVTIELVDVPEAKALRTLLRSASGYMAAPRGAMSVGVSRFDRILILATSKPAPQRAAVASPGGAVSLTPTVGRALGQQLGVASGVPLGRTPFSVSPAQQEQLDQLQQLLQQPDLAEGERAQPAGVPAAVGTLPAARPGMPMETADPRQGTASVPTGAFGTVDIPTGAFGSTTVPETSGRSESILSIPRP